MCKLLLQIYYFYKFADEQVQPYNEKDATHEETLAKLYNLTFSDDLPLELKSHRWTEIGF